MDRDRNAWDGMKFHGIILYITYDIWDILFGIPI